MSTYDVQKLRQQFPALNMTVNDHPVAYFDGPSGTQVPKEVINAVTHYYKRQNANRHGAFATSIETEKVLINARERTAALLGADADEIAFGANMTSLNFKLARGLARNLNPGDEIIITDQDHEANRDPWLDLRENGAVIKSVRMNMPQCSLDMDDFKRKITSKTRIIAVGWASNLSGTINDMKTIGELAREVDATLVVDAVHYTPHHKVNVRDIDCDFLLCSAYKFFGPHVGVLFGKRESFERLPAYRARPQSPQIPHKIETGTLNHEGISGTAAAVEFISQINSKSNDIEENIEHSFKAINKHEKELASKFIDGLQNMPEITLFGPDSITERTPTVAFTKEGITPRSVAEFLAKHGVFVGDGHFYAMTVVEKLGLASSGGVVRVGFAPYNTLDEVESLLQMIEDVD